MRSSCATLALFYVVLNESYTSVTESSNAIIFVYIRHNSAILLYLYTVTVVKRQCIAIYMKCIFCTFVNRAWKSILLP